MKNEKPRILALVLMLVHDVMLAFWGFLLWALPDQVLGVSSQSFLNRSWSSMRLSDSRMTDFVTHYMRFWGLEGLLMAMVLTVITIVPYKKGELWAWVCIAASSSIGWIAAVVLDIQLGLLSIIYIDVVPLILAWCSLAIAGRLAFGGSKKLKGKANGAITSR
jgi:hypothetical protein